MSKRPSYLSRRDFLKVAGATSVGALLASCDTPRFEPPKELLTSKFDRECVIFNGKTVSLNELDMTALGQVLSVKDRLREIKQGTFSKNTPQGYLGSAFPEGWEPDVDNKVAIIVNETESGNFVTQALIGRKKTDDISLTGEASSSEKLVNAVVSSSCYADHSLLVEGPWGGQLWFDNVESENENGKTRVVVDSRQGKIYQINTNKPNLFESWFKKDEVTLKTGEIDLLTKEKSFTNIRTPFHDSFLSFLKYFVNRLSSVPTPLDNQQKLKYINLFFGGSRMDGYKIDSLKELFGDSQDIEQIIEVIKRFSLDLPFNKEERAFVSAAISQKMEALMVGEFTDDFKDEIKAAIPDHDDRNRNEVMQIIEEKTSLPMAAPELYFIKVQGEGGDSKWFLTGRSSVWENDVDRTAATSNPDGFSIGENWFTYGEVDLEIVDNQLLRQQETIINNLPFDEIVDADQNRSWSLLGDIFRGNYEMVEARKVNSEAVVFGWDPAEGDSKHSINSGLMLMDENGNERFLKLKLQGFGNDNIDNLPLLGNQWLPIIGAPYSPRILKDVTEDTIRLIQQGYEITSPFGFSEMADYSLMANLAGEGSYTDYTFLQENMTPSAFDNMIQPGQIWKGGDDNAMLVFAENEQGEPVKIYKYNDRNEIVKGEEILVNHPFIVSPEKVGEYIGGGGNYVVLAVDKEDNATYAVRSEDVFQLGARSARKLGAMLAGEALGIIALIFGGFKLVGNIPLAGNFNQNTVASLAENMLETS